MVTSSSRKFTILLCADAILDLSLPFTILFSLTPKNATARYFGFYDQNTRNSNVTEMATFTTIAGTNKLARPLNGGQPVAFGALKNQA